MGSSPRGDTDEDGKVELKIPLYPAMDLEATAGRLTARMDVLPGRSDIQIQVRGD